MVDDFKISGKKFALLRARLIMSQPEFAQALEMSLANVRSIESSKVPRTIRPKYQRKLAEVAKVTPDELRALLSDDEAFPHEHGISVSAAVFALLKTEASRANVSIDEAAERLITAAAGRTARPARKAKR